MYNTQADRNCAYYKTIPFIKRTHRATTNISRIQNRHDERQEFLTRILVGAWAKKHKHVLRDAIAGFATGAIAKAWALQYGLDRVKSFSFRRCIKEAASSLAVEWCSRMQYFFSIWHAQEDSDYCFTQADLDEYCKSRNGST